MRRGILFSAIIALALAISIACQNDEPSEDVPDESATPTETEEPTPTEPEDEEATATLEPTESPAATEAPENTPIPDAPGAVDFREVGRFPTAYIERWQANGIVTDCQGVGPVQAYERWEIHYRMADEDIRPAAEILNHLLSNLVANGWTLNSSNPFSIMVYKGTDPGELHYNDCNPAGQTDWVYVGVNSDTSGIHVVQVVMPQGSNPY